MTFSGGPTSILLLILSCRFAALHPLDPNVLFHSREIVRLATQTKWALPLPMSSKEVSLRLDAVCSTAYRSGPLRPNSQCMGGGLTLADTSACTSAGTWGLQITSIDLFASNVLPDSAGFACLYERRERAKRKEARPVQGVSRSSPRRAQAAIEARHSSVFSRRLGSSALHSTQILIETSLCYISNL